MKDKEDIIADVVVAIIVLTTLGLFIIALLWKKAGY